MLRLEMEADLKQLWEATDHKTKAMVTESDS